MSNSYYGNGMPVIFLDIRSRQEYCHGHLPNAVLVETPNIPNTQPQFDDLIKKLQKITKHLPKNASIKVYCRKGIRANIAHRILVELGFTNVTNIGGVETEPVRSYMLSKGLIERC